MCMHGHERGLLLGHVEAYDWKAFRMHVFIYYVVYVTCVPRLWVELMSLKVRMLYMGIVFELS